MKETTLNFGVVSHLLPTHRQPRRNSVVRRWSSPMRPGKLRLGAPLILREGIHHDINIA
jgi:hypothetical protein